MLALALRPPAGARLHARRTVEQNDDGFRGAARRRAEPAPDERPGHGPDEKENREHPAREQEVLANLRATRGRAVGLEQKEHRRPMHRLVAKAVQQMDDQWQENRRQRPEHPWLKIRHSKIRVSPRRSDNPFRPPGEIPLMPHDRPEREFDPANRTHFLPPFVRLMRLRRNWVRTPS